MDPNLPQTQIPQNPSGRKNVIIISILVFVGLLLGGFFYINYTKKSPQPTPTPSPTPSKKITSPVEEAFSKIRTVSGKITAVTNDLISVNTGSIIETFSLVNLVEVGEVLDPADGSKTKKVEKIELKVGQNVQIITNEASNSARIVLIIK